jgi:hypothetical protein
VVTDNHGGRTRPLCEWPEWPKYDGAGDVNRAESFSCVGARKMSAGLQAVAE